MRYLIATVLACCLPAPVTQARAEPAPVTRFALVVGHNVGSHRTAPLSFAEKDAAKVADIFRNIGRTSEKNILVLTGPDAAGLRESLATLNKRISGSVGPTEFLFYYSGHADGTGLQLGKTVFSLDELRTILKESTADVTIAIIDACHSGAIIRDKGGKRVPILDLTATSEGSAHGLAIITSSSASEKSQESDELRGSFFTHFLASGMRGDADASGDGRVTLYELYQYAYSKTRQRSFAVGGGSQHPTFDYAMTGSGEVVVTYPSGGSSRIVLPADMEGNYLLYSPAMDSVLAEVEKKKGESRVLAVPPGTIELFKRTDSALHRTTVTVADGEEKLVPAEEMMEVSRSYLIDKGEAWVFTLGAKGGYQVFWDNSVRRRSLLPSVMGGLELRVSNLLGPNVSPFAEVLVGGAASTNQGGNGPLAQTFSCVEAGAGVAFTLLRAPLLLEVSPQLGLYYADLVVEQESGLEGEPNRYAMATPSLSLYLGKEFARMFSVAVQVKAGYLYFRDSVSDYGDPARHLGFSEVFLTAALRL